MLVVFAKIFALLCVLLLYGILPSNQAEKHSLYYIYTGLSKPVDLPGIYEFSAMGLLDDTQIDYYNSKDQRTIPTQKWMKENLQEDYWEKGTESRKSKERWFRLSLKNLMDRMKHNESDYPDVHLFVKSSIRDETKLKLTCLATGFYLKDVMVFIRKYRAPLPEDEIESTGIRPNNDGTFQMRKSVEIKEEDKDEYDCFVSHESIKVPIIVTWDKKCLDCPPETDLFMIGFVIIVVLALASLVVYIFVQKKMNDSNKNIQEPNDHHAEVPLEEGLQLRTVRRSINLYNKTPTVTKSEEDS